MQRPRRLRARRRPVLYLETILVWADAHHQRTGRWPTTMSEPILEAPGETWAAVDRALRCGCRGLVPGSSLPQLLADRRGMSFRPRRSGLGPLTEDQILSWMDAHHARTGQWPNLKSGSVVDVPGETWAALNKALDLGRRGLLRGSSLARLLADRRRVSVRSPRSVLGPLTEDQILSWMDAHHARTGQWPRQKSGLVVGGAGDTWSALDEALRNGRHGLPGGSCLTLLLERRRGVRSEKHLPAFSEEQILAWADAHHRRTGDWPRRAAGPVSDAPGETWAYVNAALVAGTRGLPGGSSLARLLKKERGQRNHLALPPLTIEQILAWVDAHQQRTGKWPRHDSGPIPDTDGDTWSGVDSALHQGCRGLPGGSTLARELEHWRGVPHPDSIPRLTNAQILAWADEYHCRTGQWPRLSAGTIPGTEERWAALDNALRRGSRGLPGDDSLARLLQRERNGPPPKPLPLTVAQILAWADAHHQATGEWPTGRSGPIPGSNGEVWASADAALVKGQRGLAGGSSLARLLAQHRGRPYRGLPPLRSERD